MPTLIFYFLYLYYFFDKLGQDLLTKYRGVKICIKENKYEILLMILILN